MTTPKYPSLAEEIAEHIIFGTPYVIVTRQGREFNMIVKGIGTRCLYGHVATNRHFVLYAYANRPDMLPAIVEKPEDDSTKMVVFQEQCVVESSHKLIFNAKVVAAVETPWRRFIPIDIYDVSAKRKPLDAKKLIVVFPELAQYYKDGIGFVKPQALQLTPPPALPPPGQPPVLRMIDNTKPTVAKYPPDDKSTGEHNKSPTSSESEE